MATPKNDQTLRIRALAARIREGAPAPRSLPQRAAEGWDRVPTWARVVALLLPVVAGAVVEVIKAIG